MGFLYPLFLLAGLSLLIPVLIHLFNLRRYKTVLFPSTRFLKTLQLRSRKQSQLRYRALLATRLLFLAALVLAFAQPFSRRNADAKSSNSKVLYIDNSYSMSLQKNSRRLLDIALEQARNIVQSAPPQSRFWILTNDGMASAQPLPPDKALAQLSAIGLSPASRSLAQLSESWNGALESESGRSDLYYISDFQRRGFSATAGDTALLRKVYFHGVPVQPAALSNVRIDTAFLSDAVVQSGQPNRLVVRSSLSGKAPATPPVVQLSIGGQLKSAATLDFKNGPARTDTLSFPLGGTGWQELLLSTNDAALHSDDSFRITLRSTPLMNVLVVNESQPGPYLQAALGAYAGFSLQQVSAAQIPEDLSPFSLIVLNGITAPVSSPALDKAVRGGTSLCVFPGRTGNIAQLSGALSALAGVRVRRLDTAVQTVSSLQQGSELARDLFERVPENVQLPVVNWHYVYEAPLAANQESALSFRNGDPFLARYSNGRSQVYLCASGSDLTAGNFVSSYFFVPFLHKMAMQRSGAQVYALTLGRQQAAYLPLEVTEERNILHLYGNGTDAIPEQRSYQSGINVYPDRAARAPGFYRLAGRGTDSTAIALNEDRRESELDFRAPSELRALWPSRLAEWPETGPGFVAPPQRGAAFPYWKVCAILALLMLVAETTLLTGVLSKKTA